MKKLLFLFCISFRIILNAQAPPFVWAKQFEGIDGGSSTAYKVAIDPGGNVYTVGIFYKTTDFDPGVGTYTLNCSQNNNIYVSKLDVSGNFVWAKQFAGGNGSEGLNIAIDPSGYVYTTGYFNGVVDFDPGTATYTLSGLHDVFVCKLDVSGNFIWAKQFGGISADVANGLAIDASGNVYTTGSFVGTADFDPGAGAYPMQAGNLGGTFISKLNGAGNFVWAKQFGDVTSGKSSGSAITVDALGNVCSTGFFNGTIDFDPAAGIFTLTSPPSSIYSDAFISKLDALGNFVWAKRVGGSTYDSGYDIATDAANNVYTTGDFSGIADFDPGIGSFTLASPLGSDPYISKLDAAGNFVWAKQFAGASANHATDIATDPAGSVYGSGFFDGTCDFDPGAGTFSLNSGNSGGIRFVSKLDAFGNFIWAVKLGDFLGNDPPGSGLEVDAANVYTSGAYRGTTDFDPGSAVFNLTCTVAAAFVHRMGSSLVGIEENINLSSANKIYPNPNNGFFNLQFDTGIKNGRLILMNVFGQKVHEQSIIQGANEINANGLLPGLYNCILIGENLHMNSVKVAIE